MKLKQKPYPVVSGVRDKGNMGQLFSIGFCPVPDILKFYLDSFRGRAEETEGKA